MINVLQSPTYFNASTFPKSLFLAGGISNCPDWQSEVISMFRSKLSEREELLIVNPRRVGDLARDSEEAVKQIKWEQDCIDCVSHFLFWFPKETLCPITLFELGKVTENVYCNFEQKMNQVMFVGAEPEYQRKFDIDIQLQYYMKGFKSESTLESLVDLTIKQMKLKRI